ncbi:ribonuclease h protein [Artemisia annua]|uniref:Ribonuclease h protein n=1 Tax=Artemisia annua TaxID=35608 RepID=A0A2U1NFH0_ARTAN|nr:ribonuclease h protein [Artemisia annua]
MFQQENSYYNVRRNTNDHVLKSIWTFPGDKYLKLNTDGSSKGNPGPSSFGGVLRDGKGRWVCGYMGKMVGRSYTALEAEVWSIYNGLCLIKEKNLSNVLIETDREEILRLVSQEVDKYHSLKLVLDAIRDMMMEQKCYVSHTRRDGNQCADLLAKLGGTQYEEYVVLEQPPVLLVPYLVRDAKAACEFERNR